MIWWKSLRQISRSIVRAVGHAAQSGRYRVVTASGKLNDKIRTRLDIPSDFIYG